MWVHHHAYVCLWVCICNVFINAHCILNSSLHTCVPSSDQHHLTKNLTVPSFFLNESFIDIWLFSSVAVASGSSSHTSGFQSTKSGPADPSPYPCSTLPSYPSSPRSATRRKPRRTEHKSSCKGTFSCFIPFFFCNYNGTIVTDHQNHLCNTTRLSTHSEMNRKKRIYKKCLFLFF